MAESLENQRFRRKNNAGNTGTVLILFPLTGFILLFDLTGREAGWERYVK